MPEQQKQWYQKLEEAAERVKQSQSLPREESEKAPDIKNDKSSDNNETFTKGKGQGGNNQLFTFCPGRISFDDASRRRRQSRSLA